jgi:HlyD family secretion protein
VFAKEPLVSRSRIAVIGGAVVLVAAALWFMKIRAHGEAPRYRTTTIEQGDLTATVSATGSVRPVVQVQVGTQVSGTISALHADYNSRVRSGEVLAQIEPSSFQTRVAQAEATVAHAEAALKDGQRQYSRSLELLKGNYVAQADVDAAEAVVDQRKADLMQANAQLRSARLDLEHTTIHSPIDGVVISRQVDVGQTVAASLQAPELFVIANDLTQMQVETRIDEADIGRIRPGLPVRFTVDAFPDVTFEGSVSQVRLEPIIDQNVVTYTTVMRTGNDDLRLRPGMTANVTVLVETRKDVLKVANAALRFRPPGAGNGGGNGGGPGGGRSGAGGGGGAPGGAAGGRRGFAGMGSALTPVREAQAQQPAAAGDSASAGGRWGHRPHGGPTGGMAGGREDSASVGTRWGRGGRGEMPGGMHGGRGADSLRAGVEAGTASSLKPGMLYVLRDGKPFPIHVLTGITDGSMTEIHSDELKAGDVVILAIELGNASRATQLQPPPGMGGPQFRGPGGRR